jgi:anti-sigma factor RsiW
MNCSESRLALHAHLDGELDAEKSRAVEEHLAGCAACAAEAAALRALGQKIREHADRPEPSAAFAERLRASLREAAPSARRPRPLRFAAYLSLAAAALFLAWLAGFESGRPSARVRSLDALVALHVRSTDPAIATQVRSSDRHTVNPWFQGRLPFATNARDFAEKGFALDGGRVDSLDGEAAAALVYRHGPHVVTLIVARDAAGDAPPAWSLDAGYRIVTWRAGGLARTVIADVDADALEAFVALLRGGP